MQTLLVISAWNQAHLSHLDVGREGKEELIGNAVALRLGKHQADAKHSCISAVPQRHERLQTMWCLTLIHNQLTAAVNRGTEGSE